MPFQDGELDRLAQTQEICWRLRQQKKEWHDHCFQRVQDLQQHHGQRLDSLSRRGDELHSQMSAAFERSKSAFSAGDHAGAGSYAAEGRRCKAALADVNAERRRLVEPLKAAHAEFKSAQADYRKAKAEHETAQIRFKERLDYLKAQSAKARADRQAQQRERDQHREAERQRRERAIGQATVRAARAKQRFLEWAASQEKRHLQFRDDAVKVTVKNFYSKRFGCFTTDIVVAYRDPSVDYHVHIVYDEDGREIHFNPRSRNAQKKQ